MSLPMMTFSLRPSSLSTLPEIAASVSTLVVSWKLAAARKDSVLRDAFDLQARRGVNGVLALLPLLRGDRDALAADFRCTRQARHNWRFVLVVGGRDWLTDLDPLALFHRWTVAGWQIVLVAIRLARN